VRRENSIFAGPETEMIGSGRFGGSFCVQGSANGEKILYIPFTIMFLQQDL
jgi:hypothetical protein